MKIVFVFLAVAVASVAQAYSLKCETFTGPNIFSKPSGNATDGKSFSQIVQKDDEHLYAEVSLPVGKNGVVTAKIHDGHFLAMTISNKLLKTTAVYEPDKFYNWVYLNGDGFHYSAYCEILNP